MIWKVRDSNRWRKRFAVFPKKIGNRWIWLSRYAWRLSSYRDVPFNIMSWGSYEEWSLPCGYSVWKEYRNVAASLGSSGHWITPKTALKLVDKHRG